MSIGPLSEVNADLKELADYHLEKANSFDRTDRNYKYHIYRRKQILASVHSLEKAICCLPSDFKGV